MYLHFNLKYIILSLLIILQFFILIKYVNYQNYMGINKDYKTPVTFLKSLSNYDASKKYFYLTDKSSIKFTKTETISYYVDFKTSLCFINGTNTEIMNNNEPQWKCLCLPGWHGNDCGQPEIIWRAFMTSRQTIQMPILRKWKRRVIYISYIDFLSASILEIKLNQLQYIIDLFVICEIVDPKLSVSALQNKLNSGFLKHFSNKLLYINISSKLENIWIKVKNIVKNLDEDDLVITGNLNEIPNDKALVFLQLYDKWPQPILFRLKWCVYGFYWQHPQKTIISPGAYSIRYISDVYNDKVNFISQRNSTKLHKNSLVLGDLNHYGGWFCEYCNEPPDILLNIQLFFKTNNTVINWDNINNRKITVDYIENLLGDGIYINGKTELKRVRNYESYYAPDFVTSISWKYDWLLTNLYSKNDY